MGSETRFSCPTGGSMGKIDFVSGGMGLLYNYHHV